MVVQRYNALRQRLLWKGERALQSNAVMFMLMGINVLLLTKQLRPPSPEAAATLARGGRPRRGFTQGPAPLGSGGRAQADAAPRIFTVYHSIQRQQAQKDKQAEASQAAAATAATAAAAAGRAPGAGGGPSHAPVPSTPVRGVFSRTPQLRYHHHPPCCCLQRRRRPSPWPPPRPRPWPGCG